MAEYPWRDHLTGDAPGCEHQGKPSPPMREKQQLLNSWCYLVARWILVWDGNERQTRIGVYHSQPENPRPNLQTQGESSMNEDGR